MQAGMAKATLSLADMQICGVSTDGGVAVTAGAGFAFLRSLTLFSVWGGGSGTASSPPPPPAALPARCCVRSGWRGPQVSCNQCPANIAWIWLSASFVSRLRDDTSTFPYPGGQHFEKEKKHCYVRPETIGRTAEMLDRTIHTWAAWPAYQRLPHSSYKSCQYVEATCHSDKNDMRHHKD